MEVAILGCGALGGVMAARLAAQPGIRLTVINRNPHIAEAVKTRGLVLAAGRRRRTLPVAIVAQPGRSEGDTPFDALILATKSNGLVEEATKLAPYLSESGFVITTQNGLVALELADALGRERLIPGCVLWGASMQEPGEYRITATGPFIIGSLQAESGQPRLRKAAELLAHIFPVTVSASIKGVLWSKLAITSTFTTMGLLTGLRFGALAASSRIRRLMLAIGGELFAVARAEGVALEPLGGGLNIERLLSERGYPAALKHLLIRIIGFKHRRTESGMLDSLKRSRKTEIDFINGKLVALAEKAAVPVPYNRLAVKLAGEMEEGKRNPRPDNLDAFLEIENPRRSYNG